MNCCERMNFDCRQGRDCPERIAGLHTNDGGHSFNGGVAFPFQPEQQDPPLTTPEAWERWATWGELFLAAVTVFCVAMVVWRVIRP